MTALGASIKVAPNVAEALANNTPVVALESTIFSELGLPSPSNREALQRVNDALTSRSVTPALTAVLDGVARVGVGREHDERICGPAAKIASRDLGVAIARGIPYGATTVSATVALAAHCGVRVFATGGIGGVHRNAEVTGDISADLPALARHPVITVTAGAKVFLDLNRTVEYLETMSVPVIGYQTDEFPAFHAPRSGIKLHVTADSPQEVAAIANAHWASGGGGLVVANPIPAAAGFAYEELLELVDVALAQAGVGDGLTGSSGADAPVGPGVTPAILGELAAASDGRTVIANLALAENNAVVAADIATALVGI